MVPDLLPAGPSRRPAVTDNISTEILAPAGEPSEEQMYRARLRAAQYALEQPDPAGVLAELLAALGLGAGRPGPRRCAYCDKVFMPTRRGPRRQRFCSLTCARSLPKADGRET